MKEMKNTDVMALMNDIHNVFFKKYRDMELSPDSTAWDDIVADAGKLMDKYKEFIHMECGTEVRSADAPILWMLGILERRSKKNE